MCSHCPALYIFWGCEIPLKSLHFTTTHNNDSKSFLETHNVTYAIQIRNIIICENAFSSQSFFNCLSLCYSRFCFTLVTYHRGNVTSENTPSLPVEIESEPAVIVLTEPVEVGRWEISCNLKKLVLEIQTTYRSIETFREKERVRGREMERISVIERKGG